MIKLPAELFTSTGREFNASAGEEYFESCFASHVSSLLSRHQQARVCSSLRTEEFLPGLSLLLNAQRKNSLHEGGFDRYLTPPFQYSRIVK